MLNDCFLELGKSNFVSEYYDTLESCTWMPLMGWEASLIPRSIWEQEPILARVSKRFPITQAGILRMQPTQCYHWHVDEFRGATINMLLTPHSPSITLFGQSLDEANMLTKELPYKPSTFYLFDTQVPHTVINFGQPRYLFSLEFEGRPSYSAVKQFLDEHRAASRELY